MAAPAGLQKIARPYAQAAFDYAEEHEQCAAWSGCLTRLATCVAMPEVTAVLKHPACTADVASDLCLEFLTATGDLVEGLHNFLRLLAEKKRLLVLPEIARLYRELLAKREQVLTVNISTAVALDERYKTALADKLTHAFKQGVRLSCEIDETLIGGMMIKAGDTVMDYSVAGQLSRIEQAVAA